MEKLIKNMTVVTEHGEPVSLRVYQNFISAPSFGAPNAKVPGLKRIVDGLGEPVNYLGDGKYLIVMSGTKATGPDL